MNEVFAWLKAQGAKDGQGGIGGTTSIKWNFTKVGMRGAWWPWRNRGWLNCAAAAHEPRPHLKISQCRQID